MITITIDVRDLRRLNGQFAGWQSTFGRNIDEVFIDTVGPKLLQTIRDETPISDRSGQLDEGKQHAYTMWELITTRSSGSSIGSFYIANKAGYLNIILEGRSPGPIVSSGKKMRFHNPKTGDLVFTNYVNHPGFAGNNFVQKAVEENERLIL